MCVWFCFGKMYNDIFCVWLLRVTPFSSSFEYVLGWCLDKPRPGFPRDWAWKKLGLQEAVMRHQCLIELIADVGMRPVGIFTTHYLCIVCNLRFWRCARSSEAMEQLNWSPLSRRRSYHKAKLVFQCLHSLAPAYFSSYFTRFSSVHSYNTRHSCRLSLPKVKHNFGKNTFIFSGAKLYNDLPLNLVNTNNIQTFCRLAKNFFLST